MNADVLRIFKTVAGMGSFTKAAQKMHYTTPTVMKQMNELEEMADTKLFIRTSHGVILTEQGNSFLEFATDTLQRFDSIVLQLHLGKQLEDRKELRVGVSSLLPLSNANDDFAMIMKLYPKIKITIVPIPQMDKFDDSFGVDYDCVISPFEKSEYEGNEVSLFQFGYTRLCFAVPYTHSLSRYDSISINDLYDETIVVRKKGTVRCHDIFREDVQCRAKKIGFLETDRFYTFDTINSCINDNMILLSLENWSGIHPFYENGTDC